MKKVRLVVKKSDSFLLRSSNKNSSRLLNVPYCKVRGQGQEGQRNVPRGRQPGQAPHEQKCEESSMKTLEQVLMFCASRENATLFEPSQQRGEQLKKILYVKPR